MRMPDTGMGGLSTVKPAFPGHLNIVDKMPLNAAFLFIADSLTLGW